MFAGARLDLIRQRKEDLLQTLEAQRRMLVLECLVAHQRMAWLERAVALGERLGPVLGLVTPLLGAWLSRRSAGPKSWLSRLTDYASIAVRLTSVVQKLFGR
jgi:hypothetical protein